MVGETVVVIRGGSTTDRYGGSIADWTSATETEVDGVKVAPRLAEEVTDAGRQGVPIGLSLYFPPDTDVRANDRIEVRGDVYEVDGEPGDWRHPSNGRRGIELAVRRVEG